MRLAEKEQFYSKLAVLLEAGVSIDECLRDSALHRDSFVEVADQIKRSGLTLAGAMEATDKRFDEIEIGIIRLGEDSGRLADNSRKLAEWYQTLEATRQEIVTSLLYPVLLLHLAPFILGLPMLVQSGSLVQYLKQVLFFLIPIYLLIALIRYLPVFLRRSSGPLGMILDRFVLQLPVVGGLVHSAAMSRYWLSLAYALDSGLDVKRALRLSRAGVTNSGVSSDLLRIEKNVAQGQELSRAFLPLYARDDSIKTFITAGERSGEQVKMFQKLHEYCYNDFRTLLTRTMKLAPAFVFLIVAGSVGYQIVNGAKEVLRTDQLNELVSVE